MGFRLNRCDRLIYSVCCACVFVFLFCPVIYFYRFLLENILFFFLSRRALVDFEILLFYFAARCKCQAKLLYIFHSTKHEKY